MTEVFGAFHAHAANSPAAEAVSVDTFLRLNVSPNFPFMAVLKIWIIHPGRDLRNHLFQCSCSSGEGI